MQDHFLNTGPVPPQVERETTYTIIWTLVNSANPLSGGMAIGTLPLYVRWMGIVSPSYEDVVFIENTRTIRWALGDIGRGVGITDAPREIAFQVALLPSISQIKKSPVIVSRAEFSGLDQFTDSELKAVSRKVTTDLTTDPQYKRGDGKVVE